MVLNFGGQIGKKDMMIVLLRISLMISESFFHKFMDHLLFFYKLLTLFKKYILFSLHLGNLKH